MSAELAVDPITLEVIRNRLDVIAEEMEVVLLKAAHSAIVKEALDASAAIFDAQGRTMAQAAAIPAHLGMLVTSVKRVVADFEREPPAPGDVYIVNDPYDGGTHLPDVTIVAPVFYDGRVVALSATMAHHQDIGGKSPGSTPPDAGEIFAEGLRIPLLKLYSAGQVNETFMALLRANVRLPDMFEGDLGAQLAACNTGARLLRDLVAELGVQTVEVAIDQLLDYAERLTRLEIEKIPDGEYAFEDYLDDDGMGSPPIKIAARVTIRGSDFHVDFSGSHPQVRGGLNCVVSSTMCAVYYVIRAITDPTIPMLSPDHGLPAAGHHRERAATGAGRGAHHYLQADRGRAVRGAGSGRTGEGDRGVERAGEHHVRGWGGPGQRRAVRRVHRRSLGRRHGRAVESGRPGRDRDGRHQLAELPDRGRRE